MPEYLSYTGYNYTSICSFAEEQESSDSKGTINWKNNTQNGEIRAPEGIVIGNGNWESDTFVSDQSETGNTNDQTKGKSATELALLAGIAGDKKVIIGVDTGWTSYDPEMDTFKENEFTKPNSGMTIGDNQTDQVVVVSGQDTKISSGNSPVGTQFTASTSCANADHVAICVIDPNGNGDGLWDIQNGTSMSKTFTATIAGTYTIKAAARNTPGESDPGTERKETVTYITVPHAPINMSIGDYSETVKIVTASCSDAKSVKIEVTKPTAGHF